MDNNEEKKNSSEDITPFAATNFRNRQRTFGIKTDDRRRHVYVIGKTGMGKSTLLENMVYSDIQSGRGVAYIDPHGDTAEKVLQWIPEHRVKDTIYFNPSDLLNPIAFNVLEKVEPEFRNLVASGLVSVYKKLWADSWGPRLEYILRYCILALLDSPDSTLLGINRMLVDDKYREIVLSRVQDPVVRSFWVDEFTKWNDRTIAEVISPIQNKVGQFLSNTMIRNIVGQRESTLNLREIMDNEKILILNLSKGRMGEDASALLGAMMITKIQLASMSRVDTPEEERKDFFLYVDEFQNFATESFATILSEARKYRLCLTIAHQYIAQLEQGGNTAVRDAVFGNVGTIMAFRVGAGDAEFLEKEFTPQFTIEDIVNLPKYKMYLRLMVDGVATDPFSADSLPPLALRDLGYGQTVINYTREHYSRSKSVVENAINDWQRAPGGVVNPEQLVASSDDFDTEKKVLETYEKIKAEEERKSKKEAEKKQEKNERESRPIVWQGECDVCGKNIGLTFEPDATRPILCPDDLRDFRKGDLKGEQLEKLMDKVSQRKIKLGGGQKRGGGGAVRKSNNGFSPKKTEKKPAPPINEGKPQIRIVQSFSDEERRAQEEAKAREAEEPKEAVAKKSTESDKASNPSSVKPGEKIEF